MRKLFIIGIALLALGCTKPQPTSTPVAAPEEMKPADRKDAPPTMSDDVDGKKSEERTRVTGYGEDPGEETQE